MKKSVLLKIIVGALLIPILSLFLISKFNFFSYFSFIPGDYQYEAGLGSYMFVLDVIYEYVVYHILRGQAKITFIMYKSECEINVNNTPTVVCSDNNYGVGSFNCNIKLEGNIKKLRRTRILLPLPPWLTYQIPKSDEIVSSTDDGIIWDFSNILLLYQIQVPDRPCFLLHPAQSALQ